MSYKEAIRDGIRIQGHSYFPLCHMCGQEVKTLSYVPTLKYTCQYCKLERKKKEREARTALDVLTKENKLDNAIARISKVADVEKYAKAISIVRKHLHTPNWFESTEEIMVALQLLKDGIKTKHQVKIGRYRADFVLTDLKIVLEVDGKRFHPKENREKENLRDSIISIALGPSWEIIHITDDDLNNNITHLLSAIKRVVERRRCIRAQHDGIIPEWYSDRNI